MPQTALNTKGVKTVAMTIQEGPVLRIDFYPTDENYKPTTGVQPSTLFFDHINEENWHKGLRKEASEKGYYVKEYSTDHQWNPDYIEEKESDHGPDIQ
tara:strand:+ start:95 stop:388 length:294 start_codon:yes stop_codon:yes gene_type:complete